MKYLSHPVKVITIVPRLPRMIDGVGDYSLCLAQELKQKHHIETLFIVCDPDWNDHDAVAPFSVEVLAQSSDEELFKLLCRLEDQASVVLFQLSGYGYHKWSIYSWIVKALIRWKQRSGDRVKLVTMFHELYKEMGLKPWRHRFWFGPMQKHLVKQLSQISDVCVTNCNAYAKTLRAFSRGKHSNIPILPVFSNIPVPTALPNLSDRQRRLVVFGLQGTRARVYNQSSSVINEFCIRFGIQEIIDIGKPTGLDLQSRLILPVTEVGHQSQEEVSKILQNAMVGWTFYDANLLSKSGIFAAYCAHGVVPVVTSPTQPDDNSELTPHQEYLLVNSSDQIIDSLPDQRLQTISDRCRHWYHSHTLFQQAQVFSQILQNDSTSRRIAIAK
ncbi:MAG: hypothetical protein B0A82_07970 [Alkalinema sp. CACIAM 70d]|nr:MAG: hypothetical protein B0A82_07970 [Alkalinema sp. CACIAM 70d]